MSDIDDPFKPPDATMIQRPRPGLGRRGVADARHGPGPSASVTMVTDARPVAAHAWAGGGLSPLLQAASPVLLLTGQIRGMRSMPNLDGLRRQALDEIRRFEDGARAAGVANETVVTGRYALCASLDEAVLSTPWGAQSGWGQQTLLVTLHNEAWGGEKFFEVLDRIGQDPARYIDLLELQYLCLALGFTGKYQVMDRGHARLAEIQQHLYRTIRTHRGAPPAALALSWQGVEDRRNPIVQYVPWWVVGAAALVLVMLAFTIAATALSSAASPVYEALNRVGFYTESAMPSRPPAAGPSLTELLDDAMARGAIAQDAIAVIPEGSKTTIRIVASDPELFASASAAVNEAYRETILEVAGALNRVQGRVRVVGHTDSQALRALLEFSNNFELSQARAESVAAILRERVAQAGRIEPLGVGDTDPLVDHEIDAESRARNRRVEIIHDPGF